MARPNKEGLEYFSLDVDMDQDDKIAFIESKYGITGFAIIIKLLARIYKDGYYSLWTEREQFLFNRNVNVDINTTLEVVNACINEGLFNKNIYEKYSILTSNGIQKRFIKACERRKTITMVKEYFLANDFVKTAKINNIILQSINVNNNPIPDGINVYINPVSDGINVGLMSTLIPQSKVKESKGKKIESKESIAREEDGSVDNFGSTEDELYPSENAADKTAAALTDNSQSSESSSDDNQDFLNFWNVYPKRSGMPRAMEAWNKLLDNGVSSRELISAAGKYAVKVNIDKTELQFIKMPYNFLLDGAYMEYLPAKTVKVLDCPNCKEYHRCRGAGAWMEEEEYYNTTRSVTVLCPHKGNSS